ncbi:MAG TPA: NUDIX domain-containing protein [Polyangiaceae bacterium]|jgi:8-oxo-dGTP diphosphatase|nr:NUDIX domain-containing protein [Polyangiaceae bacterium]
MNEKRFLAKYRPEDFARPSVAVDVVVLTVKDQSLCVLLVQRNEHPFKGRWALPGGFLRVGPSAKEQGEDLDAAAARELEEETGLGRDQVFLDQLRAFGAPMRDPRLRVVSIAYFALVRPDLLPRVRPGGDASRVRWTPVDEATTLAFDHDTILKTALEHVRARLETTAISQSLVGDTFTIPELRAAFEIVTGKKLDRGNFRRKFQGLVEGGVVERAPGKRATASKPAAVYRFRSAIG